MKILAKVDEKNGKYALLYFSKISIYNHIRKLVNGGKYTQAILVALRTADALAEVDEREKGRIKANLLITRSSAHWDLTV